MEPLRLDIYDPLYDLVTLEDVIRSGPRAFMDAGFDRQSEGGSQPGSDLDDVKVILPFVSTVEFTRQSFLRQSNLAFLVYPSATHTRLAHSLGSCYLGTLASQQVGVGRKLKYGKIQPPVFLAEFLKDNGWREEFYLALLLHDIGHFPFSHALETNKEFWDSFKKETHHEEVACQLILGKGPFYDATVRRVAEHRKDHAGEHPHLAELFSQYRSIDKYAICYLISGNKTYLFGKTPKKRAQLQVLHELVSGLLDLDRVDHYRRDNYFTGIRAGSSLNYPSLLSGLTIYYHATNPALQPELRLSPFAIGHAISLLLSKERLTEDCFEHPLSLAYEVMLHHVFNLYFFGDNFYELPKPLPFDEARRNDVYDMLVSTDEQLLSRMSQAGSKRVQEIAFRIMNRRPYIPVARLRFPSEHEWSSIRQIRNRISLLAGVPKTDVVLRVSKKFGKGKPGSITDEWLNVSRLRNSTGKHLEDGKYDLHIEHFKNAQVKVSRDRLWLYATSEEKAKKVRKALTQILDEFQGLQKEDL